jgi:hypothetical protein
MTSPAYSLRDTVPRISVGGTLIGIVALSLPVMDFAGLGGSAYVKPLALLTMLVALAFRVVTGPASIALPYDRSMKLALLFWGWGLIGGLIMPLVVDASLELKGQSLYERVFRDLFALSLGFLFWIFIRTEMRDTASTVRAVRFMLVSFWIVLAFSLVQIVVIVFNSDMAKAIDLVLAILRTKQAPGYKKIFGLAPEGSMLADQLMTMYIPFVLASIFQGTPVLGRYSRRVSAERLMFFLGIGVLVFTESRIGFITLIVILASAYFLGPKLPGGRRKRVPLALIVVVGGIFGIGVFVAGDKFANFFGTFGGVDVSIEDGVWSNVTRAGSMTAGVAMSLDHPLGVGTGAFPFMFERYVPNWALASPEIQALMGTDYDYLSSITGTTNGDIAERLPDSKALPVRVLAEMGLPGLMLLIGGWWYQAKGCWRVARETQVPLERVLAFGCVLSLLAMLPLSFSVNSYIWVHWLFISAIATSLVCIQQRRSQSGKFALEVGNGT